MSEPLVNEEQWAAWLTLPATKALRQVAAARRQSLKDGWELGGVAADPLLNAKAIGECQAYMMLEQMDYETVILGELTDESSVVTDRTPESDRHETR